MTGFEVPLLLLTGRKGSGKDTAATALTSRGWTRIAFADAVREMAFQIDPVIDRDHGGLVRLSDLITTVPAHPNTIPWWDEVKKHPEVRRLLQRIGTEAARGVLGEDVWIRAVAQLVEQERAAHEPVVITDCRFPNEVTWGREAGGKVIRIDRPSGDQIDTHASEAAVDQLKVDDVITNDGTVARLRYRILEYVDAVWEGWTT